MSIIRRALEVVAEEGNTTVEQLIGRRRRYAELRQVAMYLARVETSCSYQTLARPFHRDWTTVWHGAQCVEQRMAQSPEFARWVSDLRARVRSCGPAEPVVELIETRVTEALDHLRERMAADPLATLQLIDDALKAKRGEQSNGHQG